ncbi:MULTISPECIES: GAF domain-containing protein [unclassified Nostoc]|uniref:GAF domain-containing protein n=1 Tax=unclassified Nostoc TaxID=2593658 RepID=UPI002AD273E2|nr:GAF domain-containing protein [Nostoc sp. DedQUE03]MDZ7975426.1 GAF domain-containing protein [Nostoc sp. DedQUE03]MDZ8044633.1 GAF domain-containing protein [Nostoc sp. DedQUE02]
MTQQELPSALNNIVESSQTADTLFSELLTAVGDFLQSDRCFLCLHNPQNNLTKVAFCWIRTPDIPIVYNEDWEALPPSLTNEDPMFAAALRAEPSIFVEDVETADPQVLNREFEQKSFGHRALIHAHIRQDGQLWGILQPCIFGHPRIWTEYERGVINNLVEKITPLTVSYVKSAFD